MDPRSEIPFPSSMYPPSTYLNQNLFGSFKTSTSLPFEGSPGFKMKESYSVGPLMIDRPDFTNKGGVVHNNLRTSLLDEHITDYRINIDSIDRNLIVFPDPYRYVVLFAPAPSSTIKYFRTVDGVRTLEERRVEGEPGPHIVRSFKNVKCVCLDNIVLPTYRNLIRTPNYLRDITGNIIYYTTDGTNFLRDINGNLIPDADQTNPAPTSKPYALVIDPWNPINDPSSPFYDPLHPVYITDYKYRFDKSSALYDERYVTLVIKELQSPHTLGTSTLLENGFMLTPDCCHGSYTTFVPDYAKRIYSDSLLGNIERLSFEFFDSCGEPLTVKIYEDNPLITPVPFECPEIVLTSAKLISDPTRLDKTKINSLYSPNGALSKNLQNHSSFIFGIMENDLSTSTKYSK